MLSHINRTKYDRKKNSFVRKCVPILVFLRIYFTHVDKVHTRITTHVAAMI